MHKKDKTMAKRGGTTRSMGSSSASASRTSSEIITGSAWSSAINSAQQKLNDYLLNGTAPKPNQLYGLPIGNDVKVEIRNNKSTTSDSLNYNDITLQIVQNGNILASETRNYGTSPLSGKTTTATDAMRQFFKKNSHLFDKVRYKY